MSMEQGINSYVDTLFSNMRTLSQQDGLIGKPVVQGDKTFLPVISVTVGYGGGDSQSNANGGMTAGNTMGSTGKQAKMFGDAMGIGAKVCTDAVIVIDNNNVLLAPVNAKGSMLEKIPQILNSMKGGQQGTQQQQQQQQQQSQNQMY